MDHRDRIGLAASCTHHADALYTMAAASQADKLAGRNFVVVYAAVM
jgi:hypothetical protein